LYSAQLYKYLVCTLRCCDFDLSLKIKIALAFLDRDWNFKTKVLNTFFSAFVMRISYFRFKNNTEPLLRAKFFPFLIRSIWVSKNPEFYADFRSEKNYSEKCTKKVRPQKSFFQDYLFSVDFFWIIPSDLICS
jgi:hypothetical protein